MASSHSFSSLINESIVSSGGSQKVEEDVRSYQYTLMFGGKKSAISFNDILYELNAFQIPNSQPGDVLLPTERERQRHKEISYHQK